MSLIPSPFLLRKDLIMYPYRALEWYEEDLDNEYLEYIEKGEEKECVLESLKQMKLSVE